VQKLLSSGIPIQTLIVKLCVQVAKNTFIMFNARFRCSFAVLFFIVTQIACTGKVEIVENRDGQGRLERYQRRKKDFAKEGQYQTFYPDGKLAEEARYVNDSLDGDHKYFYTNGATESVERYRNGIFEGKYEKFDSNGVLILEQIYIKGAMQGWSIAYYPNGKIKEKVAIRDNEENGPFTEYHENGALKTEGTYAPGPEGAQEQGELMEYDEQGQKIRSAVCKDGRCETKWQKE